MSRTPFNPDAIKNPGRGNDDGCNILHVDMDAFYASVEVRENPKLHGQQVIVGFPGSRSVVLSATYPARALGVHAAMSMSQAMRLAPNAIVVEPHMHLYAQTSQAVMAIFESFTPLVQPLSLDEAFLDVAGARKLIGSPTQVGDLIRERVLAQQGITCSVGVASTMFVAKLATNYAKPDGLHVVPHDQVIEFLHPLPLGSLWGVGQKSAEQLSRLGLNTVGDIASTPLKTLQRVVGQAAGEHLSNLANGHDLRRVTPNQAEKSIGAERTFDSDIDDAQIILAQIHELSDKVARRLRAGDFLAKTITIKVRFADFTTITRSKSLSSSTDVGNEIYAVTKQLFEGLHLARARVRLVGVRATGLVSSQEGAYQMSFSERISGWREAEQVMDKVAEKFGDFKVGPARLIRPEREY